MIVRYVRLLTESQRHTLAEIMKHEAIPRARVRAHGILLSSQGMQIKEIAKIYQVLDSGVFCFLTLVDTASVARLAHNQRVSPPPGRPSPRGCVRAHSDVGARHLQE